ncbi:MAG TPA: hypothetical protein VFU31_21010 [Candidatus Binatia bacterium]|nr:hypothetical protein [Candidatus Binatia bacterium]
MKMNRRFAFVALASLLITAGCSTINPDTGQKVFDPIRTAQVKAALQAPVQETITRIIRNSPEHSDQIANYFRSAGNVFCKMRDTSRFEPQFLIAELEKATEGLQQGLDPLAITAKNTIIALYVVFYSQRQSADLSPEKFLWNTSDLFCNAINTGLKDAGKPGTS